MVTARYSARSQAILAKSSISSQSTCPRSTVSDIFPISVKPFLIIPYEGRGGQSALRFSRLRDEKRHNYVRKVAEHAVQHFITNDKVNVAGLVLAGSADFKTELNQSDMFDPRLAAKVIKVVDVSYGGENGFNQAIELAAESLSNVKFVQEKKLIQHYFDEISQDTGKYCFGVDDTLKGLEMGAVETLIVWENLDVMRYTLRNAAGEDIVIHVSKDQEKDREKFIDKSTGLEMEQSAEPLSLLEWFADKYKEFGATLEASLLFTSVHLTT